MPGDDTRCLASMGNYVFDTQTLIDIVTPNEEEPLRDMGGDVIPALAGHGAGILRRPPQPHADPAGAGREVLPLGPVRLPSVRHLPDLAVRGESRQDPSQCEDRAEAEQPGPPSTPSRGGDEPCSRDEEGCTSGRSGPQAHRRNGQPGPQPSGCCLGLVPGARGRRG